MGCAASERGTECDKQDLKEHKQAHERDREGAQENVEGVVGEQQGEKDNLGEEQLAKD